MRRSLAGVALAAAFLSGCGGSDDALTVMVAGDPAELDAYRQVVAAYEREPGAPAVRLIEVADRDDLVVRLSSSIAAGTPPDLFLINYRAYGQFQVRGALEPVGPYLDRPEGLDAEDFYERPLDAFRDDGVQTCLPQNASSLVVYYNEDLLRAAGLAPPGDRWTWDEMVAAARAMTADTDGDGRIDIHGLGVEPTLIRVAPFVWSAGGEVVDDERAPARMTLGSVPAARALQAFIDLRAIEGVTPTDEETESVDLETRFLEGTLGMLMESRKVVPTFRSIDSFLWDVAPLPVHDEPVTILHSDAYCMTAGSERHEDAWRFLEFALGPRGQAVAAATGRTVPSLRSVAASPSFLEGGAPSRSQVFLDNIDIARPVPHVATWPEIEDAVDALLEEAFYEPAGGEVPELIVAIEEATAPLFARASEVAG